MVSWLANIVDGMASVTLFPGEMARPLVRRTNTARQTNTDWNSISSDFDSALQAWLIENEDTVSAEEEAQASDA